MNRSLGPLAYLTTAGTAPWIVGGLGVAVLAVVLRARSSEPATRGWLLMLAALACVFSALAVVVLAASRVCEGAGGCGH